MQPVTTIRFTPAAALRPFLARRPTLSRTRLHSSVVSSPLYSSPFSTYRPLLQGSKPRSSDKPKDAPSSGNPDFPSWSFEELGISKNMKIVIYALVGVLGTIETWTWSRAAYYWWNGRQSDDSDDDQGAEGAA
ncbi:hypothetical protein C8Q76DRAFT_789854 [Earliella scabrosa]|nr:hypothetical protein C8Q76DRAFT_789854 [Earliella scabrosa]